MLRFSLAALAVAACSANPTPATDAAVKMDAKPVDASNLPLCTGAAFDPCTDPSQCMSNNCHLFQASMFQVCTVSCTPGDNTTCPGTGATCNNMGICKPVMPNACHRDEVP
jgi:hypothetical protein